MKTLDAPLTPRGRTGPVIWTEVRYKGRKYNLQAFVDTASLERAVAASLDASNATHTFQDGNVIVCLTEKG